MTANKNVNEQVITNKRDCLILILKMTVPLTRSSTFMYEFSYYIKIIIPVRPYYLTLGE